MCIKVNVLLDSDFYERRFIKNIKTILKNRCKTSDKMQENIMKPPLTKTKPKIGTIPYYFNNVSPFNRTLSKTATSETTSIPPFFRKQE